MPDATQPVWMEWVKAPLLLLTPDGVTVLALNIAARRLLAEGVTQNPPAALERLVGASAARLLSRALERREETSTVLAPLSGHTRRVGFDICAIDEPPGHWLVTIRGDVADDDGGAIPSLFDDLQAVLEWMPVGIEIYDDAGNCIFTNTHGQRLFGWDKDELVDLEDWWLQAYPDPDYRLLARKAWEEALETSRLEGVAVPMSDWKVRSKDGTERFIHFRLRCIGDHPVLIYWDVSDERQIQAELRHRAETDELTGLRNRRRFFADALSLLDAPDADGQTISVLMIDIDHFKRVNDLHGHAVGDEVLRAVAQKCRAVLGDSVLARLGGEEFAALLPGIAQPEAARRAEELRSSIENQPVEVRGLRIELTVSIGVATARAPFDIDMLLVRADQALYAAKRAGRDRVALDSGAVPVARQAFRSSPRH